MVQRIATNYQREALNRAAAHLAGRQNWARVPSKILPCNIARVCLWTTKVVDRSIKFYLTGSRTMVARPTVGYIRKSRKIEVVKGIVKGVIEHIVITRMRHCTTYSVWVKKIRQVNHVNNCSQNRLSVSSADIGVWLSPLDTHLPANLFPAYDKLNKFGCALRDSS